MNHPSAGRGKKLYKRLYTFPPMVRYRCLAPMLVFSPTDAAVCAVLLLLDRERETPARRITRYREMIWLDSFLVNQPEISRNDISYCGRKSVFRCETVVDAENAHPG